MNTLPFSLNLNGKLLDLSSPVVMGIVNITPDSFYQNNRFTSEKSIMDCVERCIAEGASILDIGGYSTRPMAEDISIEEEKRRVSTAIELILKHIEEPILSVDTFRSEVAKHVVDNYKVAMINDIGGGTLDKNMFRTIAELKVSYVLMHTNGTPQTMQNNTNYNDLLAELISFFQTRLHTLRQLGVNDIIIDPGFGFAKNLEQNYLLLNKLSYLKELNVPLLAGLSRKSMIFKLLNTTPDFALNGTTASNMLALIGGANILRVHDVKEAIESIKIFKAFLKFNN